MVHPTLQSLKSLTHEDLLKGEEYQILLQDSSITDYVTVSGILESKAEASLDKVLARHLEVFTLRGILYYKDEKDVFFSLLDCERNDVLSIENKHIVDVKCPSSSLGTGWKVRYTS
jgi:hypothetical protein